MKFCRDRKFPLFLTLYNQLTGIACDSGLGQVNNVNLKLPRTDCTAEIPKGRISFPHNSQLINRYLNKHCADLKLA